ncbi:MAG: hypothetical protein CM15mP58_15940 [Burkholderiaceae bacterium]|nr:MAG: hypothetical protein CM15mP58_15940 [Burkholderiaceae bacterium]
MQNVKTNCQREFGSFLGEGGFSYSRRREAWSVLLELPEDIAAEETDAKVLNPTKDFMQLAAMKFSTGCSKIKAAKRPLILVGAGANRRNIRRLFRTLFPSLGFHSSVLRWVKV